MIFTWLLHKVKAFFLFFVNLFRRALCCIRKRRTSETVVPLTHVVSDVDKESDLESWTNWGEEIPSDNKPRTVQDYIELYRQQTVKARTIEKTDEKKNEDLNLFEDMSPKITKQTKVLIRTKNQHTESLNNRLNVVDDSVNVMTSAELEEWDEENRGWEGEQLLDREAQRILREQKRLEREKKAWEQHQKRLEKASRALGSKLIT